MTVVDTSALMAIAFDEPEAAAMMAVLSSGPCSMSAATLVEATVVVGGRLGQPGQDLLLRLVERLGIEVVPFDARQAHLATAAWNRFGKGRHPARLNLGDCFSYALAKTNGEPLLFKGDDFPQTDIATP